MTTPTIPFKWIDPYYVKWSDKKMNDSLKTSLLNPLKNCTNVTDTPEQVGLTVSLSFAHIVIRVLQYITLVGQH